MKKQNRRNFIKTSTIGALGVAAIGHQKFTGCTVSKDDPPKSGIGLQLYTIRHEMAKDIPASLKKVAHIGYQYVELAGYADGKFYGIKPEEFKLMVDDLGMKIISSHASAQIDAGNTNNINLMAEAHAKLGAKYCIQPWLVEERRVSADSYKHFVADLNAVGAIMKKHGIQFGYHNHDFEFHHIDGLIPFIDIFMPESDPDLLTFEIDIFWVKYANYNPISLIQNFPGRFQLFHIKDMENSNDKFFAPVGEGIIDFKAILEYKDIAGMKYMFVEQDSTRDGNAMGAIESSFNNLKNMIL